MLLIINSSPLSAKHRCCTLNRCQFNAILNSISQGDANITTILNQINNTINNINNQTSCDDSIIQIRQADIPYTITAPGEYCLAEDITITSGDAITIVASGLIGKNVVLDLNDKTINGSGTADNGIILIPTKFVIAPQLDLIIKNGTIMNMLEHGIYISINVGSLLINSIITDACGIGGITPNQGGIVVGDIRIPFNTIIRNCRVLGGLTSTGYGIYLLNCAQGQISNCTTIFNALDGIFMQSNSVALGGSIDNCTSSFNGQNGINTEQEAIVVKNCISESNQNIGILVSLDNCAVLDNISNNNSVDGISIAAQNCQVRNNTATNNLGDGLSDSGTNNRIYGNYANNNATNNYSASIVNVATSPAFNDAINHTANIAD
jgi:parallel beta-helix repeat protein